MSGEAALSFAITVLANGLWQAALLALAAWLVLRLAKNANATTRHAVLVAALLGSIALPVVTTAFDAATRPPRASAVPAWHEGTGAATARAPQLEPADGAGARTPAMAPAALPGAGIARPRVQLPRAAILVILGLWLSGALLLLIRLAVSLLHLERLKRDALPLPIADRERLERWESIAKGQRDVRLCRSTEISVPIAVGIFDAMILIPERLLADLPADDLDRILLHELAHLRRGDDWVNALERIAEAALFFNPAIRWIVRQLDLEREVACDDWVLERRSEALPYAQCLVKLVEGVAWPHRAVTAPGVFVTRRSISIRIERLLAKQRDVRLRISIAPLAAVSAIALVACVAGSYVSPSLAAALPDTPPTAPLWSALPPPVAPAASARVKLRGGPAQRAQAMPEARAADRAAHAAAAPAAAAPAPHRSMDSAAVVPAPASPGLHSSGAGARRVTVTTQATTSETQHLKHVVESQVAALSAEANATPAPAMTGEDYIAEMASAGYTNLSVDDLIRLKSLGVSAQYVRDMHAAGFGHPSVDEIARLRALGVTPDYAREMRAQFDALSADQVAKMRALGVTPSYVADLKAAGCTGLTADGVSGMRAVGVDAAFVRSLARAGYANLSAEQYARLRAVGVDEEFLRRLAAHGFHGLSLDDLVRLKTSGALE